MKFRNLTIFAFCALAVSPSFASRDKGKKIKVSKDQFITELMGKMTLDEKIGQLVLPDGHGMTTGISEETDLYGDIKKGLVGSILNVSDPKAIRSLQKVAVNESRLKIPLLVGLDVIHGFRTIFPIPLAQSCSWDTTLVRKAARVAAIEASAYGVNWTYSPMVDVAHDARWGRIAEGNGEDPFLSACIAKSLVYGYQEDMKKNTNIAACLKHYALYGAVESGLDYNFVDMSRIRMFNEYMLPYQAAVEAGVRSVMSSFNVIDFMPASGNKWLIDDVLRKKWGFKGFTVTDYNGIAEMTSHGIDQQKRCAELAADAGIDIDMCSQAYLKYLHKLVEEVVRELSENNDYDLIFSDIRLIDGDVFEAFREVKPRAFVVFITAYEEYALKAFRNNGIDYLLKPVDSEELCKAMEKARTAGGGDREAAQNNMNGLLNETRRYRQRFLVSRGDELVVVNVDDIYYFAIEDNRVQAFTNEGQAYTLTLTMNDLEQELDPDSFFRINRQYIANIKGIRKINFFFSSKLIVRLKGCKDENIVVSKEKTSLLKKWLDR